MEHDASQEPRNSAMPNGNASRCAVQARYVRLHLLVGWWSLLAFVSMGLLLEYMHGFREPSYMNVGDAETRRMMWTLAHAHGVLIGLTHIAFAATVHLTATEAPRCQSLASNCLIAAGILMPLGFFLGGLFVYPGDPGLGIFLVPPGAGLLFIGVLLTCISVTRGRHPTRDNS